MAELGIYGLNFVAAFDCPNFPGTTRLIRLVSGPPFRGYQQYVYNPLPIGSYLLSEHYGPVNGFVRSYAQVRADIMSSCT